jgi:hypothetical protein
MTTQANLLSSSAAATVAKHAKDEKRDRPGAVVRRRIRDRRIPASKASTRKPALPKSVPGRRFYRLKFQKLNGQVFDRKLLVGELTAIFSSIREIILASSMTKREKDDCLRNLAEIPT